MTHVALVRGINVGGHMMIAMSDLRALLADVGLSNPRTLLQSGNLVFGATRSSAQLEQLVRTEIERRLRISVDVFVRTEAELAAVIERNPFAAEARRDPARLLAMFLRDAPSAASVKALQATIVGPEKVRVIGSHAYLVYPEGVGRSKLTPALVEKTLGTRGTARNWNTVLKLAAAANGDTK